MGFHEDLTDGKFAAQLPGIGNIQLDADGEICFHGTVEFKSRHWMIVIINVIQISTTGVAL